MKKLLLNVALVVLSGLSLVIKGQSMDNKGGAMAVHEAHFKVYNSTTKLPISEAGIYDKTGKKLGLTNPQGFLVLALPASEDDSYTVKAIGYKPIAVRLTHAAQSSADYEVYLPAYDGSTSTANTSPDAAQPDLVKVYVKQDPATYQKTKTTESQVEFAVQLSATSRPISDKNTLKAWEEIGPVYIHNENGLYKVRIGPYTTQENAKQVLLQVKAKGKSDAFIVVQKGIENHVPFDPAVHQAKGTASPVQETIPSTTVAENSEDVKVEYKVRLASYLKPGGFNTKDIDQYGPLESYRQGDWTIMLIGGFKTAQDAERVRDLVIAKGYKDASVVIDRGGILESQQ